MSIISQFFPSSGGGGGGGGGVPATTTVAELLVVAGGMSGGCHCCFELPGSGGPGGGVLMSSSWNFEQGCPYTVTVGAGGPATSSNYYKAGGNSSIIGYNAPPSALVGHAAVATQESRSPAAYSPTHTVNGSTYHYGTSHGGNILLGALYSSSYPGVCFVVGGSAGGAGNPGCPTGAINSPQGSPGSCYYITHLCRGPGRDGMGSDISGTMHYYGPGGHGWGSCLRGHAATSGIAQDSAGSRNFDCNSTSGMPRPSISCSGCSSSTTTVEPACANFGAGGAGSNCSCTSCSAGGSGVVFIRYPTDYTAASSISGNTPTPAQTGFHVYRFNGSGSITF